ncbi:MAG: HEPN domain-containing protein [Chloroflexi bacterium]|nr:HEPN domain-containing protein [Chloroflexota bacterium]
MRARREPNYDAACFHSQQCAEKYLKAFLIAQRVEPPRTHNLIELLRLCLKRDGTFEMIRPAFESLNLYAAVIRYPGVVSANKDDVRGAVQAMKQLREFVRGKF